MHTGAVTFLKERVNENPHSLILSYAAESTVFNERRSTDLCRLQGLSYCLVALLAVRLYCKTAISEEVHDTTLSETLYGKVKNIS